MHKIDILVVSQSCLTAINREPYRELARMGWRVEIVCPEQFVAKDFSRRADPQTEDDPPMHFLPLVGTHPRLWTFAGIEELVTRSRPKIIVLDCDAGSRLTIQLGRLQQNYDGKVTCISCDNMERTFLSELCNGPKALVRFFIATTLSALARNRVDHIFALSNDIVSVMEKRGFGDKVSKMPLGFDPGIFFPNPEARDRLRRKLNLTETTIGYFGRMTRTKGLDLLLHALHQLRDRPWHLLLDEFGTYTDPYIKEVRDLVETLGLRDRVIHFDANHEQIAAYMNAADIVVLASITAKNAKEQYGRVVPEAMACERCVIVSDSGALPELIGEAGIIVPEKNADLLAQELGRAMDDADLRATLGRKALKRALDKFSTIEQAKCMENVFKQWATKGPESSVENK